MPRIEWSCEKIGRARQMVKEGVPHAEMAKVLGIKDQKYLRAALRNHGIYIPVVHPKRGPMSDEEKHKRRLGMAAYYERQEMRA